MRTSKMRFLKRIAWLKEKHSYLDVRKLSHVCVQGVQRFVIDVLMVIQPQSVCVLNTPTRTKTHFASQLSVNDPLNCSKTKTIKPFSFISKASVDGTTVPLD